MRKLWFGQSIKEAVDEARIHHQIFPMNAEYEFGITEVSHLKSSSIQDISFVDGKVEKTCVWNEAGNISTVCSIPVPRIIGKRGFYASPSTKIYVDEHYFAYH